MRYTFALLTLAIISAVPTSAQFGRGGNPNALPTDDPVLEALYTTGMENSMVKDLAQVLADSLGPRMVGTPSYDAAGSWAIGKFAAWGIDATKHEYGTWRGWQRGISHIDLVAPRVRSLEGTQLAWSPPSGGPREGAVVLLPDAADEEAFRAWLPMAEGRFVLLSYAEPTCRPADAWEAYGGENAVTAFNEARTAAREAWQDRIAAYGLDNQAILDLLEESGALGFLTNYWTGARGTERIFPLTYSFRGMSSRAPAFNLSCEDYGLVFRLAENDQGPKIRAIAESEDLGTVPTFNVIATLPGTELPNEYVLLSAHFDAWDGGSGMTDNGTGSVTMMEAMRLLKLHYPNPKRTIVVGLWSSEEQGLNGSRAYAYDHPDVVAGLQVSLNQDNGTGRVSSLSGQGLTEAGAFFGRWLSRMPTSLTDPINLNLPGSPGRGGSDYASFVCAGAPSFSLSSDRFDYFSATWHTNRDTFDKVAWDDLRANATLTAMLAYLASEDDRIPRDRRDLGLDPRTGEPRTWPECQDASREMSDRYK